MDVESPCIRNCCLDDKDICLGCYRTLDDILAWSAGNDDDRRKILANADTRKKIRLAAQNEQIQC